MTTTEELAGRVLPAVFAAQADTSTDPQEVLAAVRGRTRKSRSGRPALLVAAVADAIQATHPEVVATVEAGNRTVYRR